MERNIKICKPHYCDRFSIPQKKVERHDCHSPSHSPARTDHLRDELHVKHHFNRQRESIKYLKMSLSKMLEESKMRWEEWIKNKQVWIKGLKEEHRKNMQKIIREIEQLRKKAYQQYKHVCSRKTDNPCRTCYILAQYVTSIIKEYFGRQNYNPNQSNSPRNQKNSKNTKSKMPSGDQRKVTQNSEKQGINKDNNSQNSKQNGSNRQSLLKNQEYHIYENVDDNILNDKTESINSQNYIRKNQRLLTSKINKRQYALFQDGQSQNVADLNNYRGLKNKNSLFKQSNRMLKTQITEGEQLTLKNINSIIEQQPNGVKNTRISTTRKSVLKYPNATGELQNNSARSKFMPMPTDNTKEDPNSIRSNKQTRSVLRIGQKSPKSSSPFSTKIQLQKQKKKADLKKKAKSPNDQQILIDLDESQSVKSAEIEPQVDEIESQLQEQAKRDKKYYKKQQHNSKLSRYRREKLFYTILKRQLADHLSSPEEEQEQEEPLLQVQEPRNTQLNASEYEQMSPKYSLMERKQSLISKLNIFKQTTNFEDLKLKITAVLENKDQFILRKATKELLVSETVDKTDDAKQKILQMFLADVLKVNDIKRLLRNKFSKERHWGQKMRQMHQFYTYLEYSLQNFRKNLNDTIENNWREISLQGDQVDFDIDELVINEDMGHYKGLQNVQLNEYQHHKEIECSMKYYGIEIKKLEQLSQYRHIQPLNLPVLLSGNVGQKSLKNIRQIPEQQLMAEVQPQKSKKVFFT